VNAAATATTVMRQLPSVPRARLIDLLNRCSAFAAIAGKTSMRVLRIEPTDVDI